jgi:hypothetical protein
MTIKEYVEELHNDLEIKWEVFAEVWNEPAHVDYEHAKFEWQLANKKYCEFTKKLMAHLSIDIDGNIDDINWNDIPVRR